MRVRLKNTVEDGTESADKELKVQAGALSGAGADAYLRRAITTLALCHNVTPVVDDLNQPGYQVRGICWAHTGDAIVCSCVLFLVCIVLRSCYALVPSHSVRVLSHTFAGSFSLRFLLFVCNFSCRLHRHCTSVKWTSELLLRALVFTCVSLFFAHSAFLCVVGLPLRP